MAAIDIKQQIGLLDGRNVKVNRYAGRLCVSDIETRGREGRARFAASEGWLREDWNVRR